ncbi:hypothetical protein KEM55_008303 [Ascosphaera atra]|nr:hypothetical protein KEM55_008303 [Ascosphaera atra]
MEEFLAKLTNQAMNYAIRSGIAITASYAFRQSSRLLKNVSGEQKAELMRLQSRLQSKVRIISPAIDMIELIAARGNTSLESSISLTKSLRLDIQHLGQRLAKACTLEELSRKGALKTKDRIDMKQEINEITLEIRQLLAKIEDAVPLINLAITTSGATLSTSLPSTVSPSRLLQASTFLTAGDGQYTASPGHPVQVGPTFTLSVYMLFAGHVRPRDEESVRSVTWKEVIHKARVKIRRVPMDMMFSVSDDQRLRESFHGNQIRGDTRSSEFAYQILIVEDFDDGRVHTFDNEEEQPTPFDDVAQAGIREVIPIHEISKIFYADTGKILNIGTEGEVNNPVLLLKRDTNAIPPRRMLDHQEALYDEYGEYEDEVAEAGDEGAAESRGSQDVLQSELDSQILHEQQDAVSYFDDPHEGKWRFPSNLDLEWIAFEVYQEDTDSDSETEGDTETEAESTTPDAPEPKRPSTPDIASRLNSLNIQETPEPAAVKDISLHGPRTPEPYTDRYLPTPSNPILNSIRTSLSLLEMLLRLTSLQQFQQQSHLSITDELLTFFLAESSTTGAGGDERHRQRLRAEARRKVGWDPYDESPVKLRGEEYQYQTGNADEWERGSAVPGSSQPNSAARYRSRFSKSPSMPLSSDRRKRMVGQFPTSSPAPFSPDRGESPSPAVRASKSSLGRHAARQTADAAREVE